MATLTLQPDAAGIDSYIFPGYSNFGSDANIYTGYYSGTYRTLLKFDLSALPDTAKINSTKLTLYLTASNLGVGSLTLEVYRVKRNWVENQVTWYNWNTANAWTTAGADHANDRETSAIGTRIFTYPLTLNQGYDISLTGTKKTDLDLGYGWLLKHTVESGNRLTFSSSDHATAAQRPQLVIQYTMGVSRNLLGVGI